MEMENKGLIQQMQIDRKFNAEKKTATVAWLLWWFTAGIAGHRFYLGSPNRWKMLFFGVFTLFIWNLCDAFKMNKLINEANMAIEDDIIRKVRGI